METRSSREAKSGMPHRLTEPELMFMRHALDMEMLSLKKCMQYADMVSDDRARELFKELGDIHHRRVDMMLNLLDRSKDGDITMQAKLLLQTNLADQGGPNHHA